MFYRATVTHTDPVRVSIPGFTGGSLAVPVEIMPTVTVAVGDRVWVVRVGGSYDWLLVGLR